jgi:hypothetical protein
MGVTEVVKFIMNRKYRFKQDFLDTALGKVPQGITATFVSTTDGSCRFKLPNGKNVGIPQKSALNLMEEC